MANEITIKFGGFNLASENNISVKGDINIKEVKSVKTYPIPKNNGSIAETAKRENIAIAVEGDVAGSGYDDLRSKIDSLRAALQNGLQKFILDDDRYVMAQLKDFSFSYTVMMTLAQWSATFIAHYPYWLAESETVDDRDPTSGVGFTINNPGNAPCRVKIEIKAPAGGISDNIQIQNTTTGELCKYRGDVAVGKSLEIDNRYDTDDFEVLNDGIDDHANFEGDFITLDPGDNTIIYTGDVGAGGDTFTIKYRAAYY